MLWPPRLLADRAEEVLLNPAPPKASLLEPKPEPEDTLRLPMLFPPLPKPELMPVLAPLGRLPAPAPAPSPVPLPGRLPALAPPERLPAPIFPAAPPPGRLPAPPATAPPPRPAAPPGRLAPPAGCCRARPPYLLAVFRSP